MTVFKTKAAIRPLWVLFGWLSLAIGFVGIFVPILPTTPLVLLAAFCFSKGSEKWHQWLLNSKTFGKMIRDWEEKGAIRLRPKIFATFFIVLLFGYTLVYVPVAVLIKGLVAGIGIGVLAFIWSRPTG